MPPRNWRNLAETIVLLNTDTDALDEFKEVQQGFRTEAKFRQDWAVHKDALDALLDTTKSDADLVTDAEAQGIRAYRIIRS